MDFGIVSFYHGTSVGVLVHGEQHALTKGLGETCSHWIELIMVVQSGPTHSYVEFHGPNSPIPLKSPNEKP